MSYFLPSSVNQHYTHSGIYYEYDAKKISHAENEAEKKSTICRVRFPSLLFFFSYPTIFMELFNKQKVLPEEKLQFIIKIKFKVGC